MRRVLIFILSCFVITGFYCSKDRIAVEPPFMSIPDSVSIKGGMIKEASGLADSDRNPGFCWVQEDSGNPPEITLLGHDGTIFKKITLNGATNLDWEDLALGEVPGMPGKMLYIAETGDNALSRTMYSIYRFAEPSLSIDTIHVFDKINFTYPDGPHDAEGILTDKTGAIYIFTKRDVYAGVYLLTFPQKITGTNTAVKITDLPYTGVVSAASSADGRELIIKTYDKLYFYKWQEGLSLETALKQKAVNIPYLQEPLGEAVSFLRNNDGFLTLSEQWNNSTVKLYSYKRK